MSEAVVALGTNLGDKQDNLQQALAALARLPGTEIVRQSSVYQCPPQNPPEGADMEDFLNMAVVVNTTMSPLALLGACLGIEAAMGRVRNERNGARIIDLDVLVFEGMKSESFELTLPHPRSLERPFVLLPLKELYPSGRAPGLFFDAHLKEVDVSQCKKVENA